MEKPAEGEASPALRGPAFIPSVLRHPRFARDGVLFGLERISGLPIRWVVLDPGRHSMEVWQKSEPSLPNAARRLGATAFTNGPFSNYGSGHFVGATSRLLAEAAGPIRRGTGSTWNEAKIFHYQATTPLGFVVSTSSGISETKVPRPRLHYIGRLKGREFEDYEIGQGDPYGYEEAIGGLFRGVTDYRPFLLDRFMRVGFWGLAPFDGDPALKSAGLTSALDAYVGSGHACDGVIVFVGGWANTLRLTELLASIRRQRLAAPRERDRPLHRDPDATVEATAPMLGYPVPRPADRSGGVQHGRNWGLDWALGILGSRMPWWQQRTSTTVRVPRRTTNVGVTRCCSTRRF
jgi:hypothetical protein